MEKNRMVWPEIEFKRLKETLETVHQWIQIVGKIRLKTMPWLNHSWHSTLYVTPDGFSTHSIPYAGTTFQIDFNFRSHELLISCSNASSVRMELRSVTVSDFYAELFEKLSQAGIHVKIHGRPNEIDPAIPFAENTINNHYDPEQANILWRAMLSANEVFNKFRSRFIGKASPVHLFWGAFDLAVTRFSGNSAPLHPGGMPNMPLDVMQEAYSQEVSSAGFWPGSADFPVPFFYSYAYPAAPDFAVQKVIPSAAYYNEELGEFILNYNDVVHSADPGKTVFDFLQSTYEAAANTSGWDRKKLERNPG